MISIEEISTWSVDQAIVEVHSALPEGWVFRFVEQNKFHGAIIEDDKEQVLWASDLVADLRIVVLSAYGWLYARTHQPSNHRWVVRPDLTPETVNAKMGLILPSKRQTKDVPDPGDLDPVEVERVLREQKR